MKKEILLDKLSLDKETISILDEQQLKALAGGDRPTYLSCANAVATEEQKLEGWASCCLQTCTGTATEQ